MSNDKYGIGYAMLTKMGYTAGQGLGKHNQGITECIDVISKEKAPPTLQKQQPTEVETIIISDDEENGSKTAQIEEELRKMGVKHDVIESLKKQGFTRLNRFYQSRIIKKKGKQMIEHT